MMLAKKITAVTVTAAFLMSGPGHLGLEAAAQSVAATVSGAPIPVIPVGGLSTGLNSGGAPLQRLPTSGAAATVGLRQNVVLPAIQQGAAPVAAAGALGVTPHKGSPAAAAARASAAPVAPAYRKAAEAVSTVVEAPGVQALRKQGADASAGDRKAALDVTFERSAARSDGAAEVAGLETAAPVTLEPASALSMERRVAAEELAVRAEGAKDKAGSLIAEVGIVAAIAAVLASIFSPSFRNYMKRMGQVVLGWIGLGVKKAETPEVVAQRIIDQLNAAKPAYNRKVQQASTLAEKIAIQIRDEKAKVAELEANINALLSDKDDSNDNLATGLIQAQKNLQASVDANTEQFKLAAANLEEIKAERTRFYQEREEMLAKINAQLSRAKAAEIQKQMADLKGGFKVGDVKDSLDRLNDIVNGMEAEAKGSKDAAESSPDEIIKKAKEQVRNQEVLDEIARRKAEIAKKQQGGQDKAGSAFYKDYAFQLGAIGLAVWGGYVLMMGLSAATLGIPAFIGFLAGMASYLRTGVSADGSSSYLPVWTQSILGGALGAFAGFGASLFTPGFLVLGATGVAAGILVPVILASRHKPSKDPLPVLRMLGMGIAGALVGATLPVWALGYLGRRIDLRKSTDADGNPDAESQAAAAKAPSAPKPTTLAKLDELRSQELPAQIVTENLSKAVSADPYLGLRLSAEQQAGLVAELMNGFKARTPASEIVAGYLQDVAAVEAVKGAESGKDKSGSLIAEIGIGAAIAAVLASIFSPSFRNYMKRMGQVVLGWIGLGVKRAETPEVVAQRIIDQLNAAKPEYNRKVEQASTLAEKIAIQIRDEKAKVAELEANINALLSDKDDSNDNLATGLIQAQKNLQASVDANTEQFKLAAANLEEIKAERARFYQEREETLARINAQLSRAKAAEIQKQMADLKGGFKVGDVKDSLDRLNDIVNGMEAEAKGSKDAAESNPDAIIKKAKEQVRNQEVLDEIARRKAELAKKSQGGQDKAGSALELPLLALIAGAVATATGRKRAGLGAIAAALGLLAPHLAWLLPLGALMVDRSERRGVLSAIGIGSLLSTAIITALVFGLTGVPVLPLAFYAAPAAAFLLAMLSPKGAKPVAPAAKPDGGVKLSGFAPLAALPILAGSSVLGEVGPVIAGIVVGALIAGGYAVATDKSHGGGGDIGAGFDLFFRAARIAFYGLIGAVAGAIAGPLVAALIAGSAAQMSVATLVGLSLLASPIAVAGAVIAGIVVGGLAGGMVGVLKSRNETNEWDKSKTILLFGLGGAILGAIGGGLLV